MTHGEFILAGSGGQGLVLAGILLAEAAIGDGRNVVQTQSYGIATRGGLSLAEVIIDSEEIVFQQVQKPDCILALTEEAACKYETWAARGVPLLYDSSLAAERRGDRAYGLPFTRIANDLANDLGGAGSVNILALASLVALTRAVTMDSLENLLRQRFKGQALDRNLKLLRVGTDLMVAP